MNTEKQYFSNLRTVEEIKNHYRALARKHHPDLGGEKETMQAINAQYHDALKRCDKQESTNPDTGNTHTYHYNAETEQALIDKISQLYAAGLPAEVRVYIIGLWVWIMGTTREDKATQGKLKAAGCTYHTKRVCWYFRPYKARHKGKGASKASLGDLANRYGCREVRDTERRDRQTHFSLAS